MDFSGFIKEEEELDLLYEAIIEEGVVGGTLRAVGGFGGNLIGQTARGMGNVVSGAGQTLKGVGRVGLGAVQGLTGGGRKAVSSLGGGVGDIASGVGSVLTGAAQTAGALSGVTPTIRGIQAATERGISPMSDRRTGLQKAMGLNSWDPEGDAAKDAAERFDRLKRMYVVAHNAGNRDQKRRIRAEMERLDPKAYKKMVDDSRALKKKRNAERWSRIMTAPPPEKPEDFLRRLGAEGQAG